jgi:hypothetical protein
LHKIAPLLSIKVHLQHEDAIASYISWPKVELCSMCFQLAWQLKN